MQVRQAELIGGLCIALTILPVSYSFADVESRLTLGERLRSVSESGFATPQNEGTSLVTTLDYQLRSQTKSDTLQFNLSTDIPLFLENNDNQASEYTFEDPSTRLIYTRDNKNSLLSFDGRARSTDVNRSNFFDETIGEDVVFGDGRRDLLSFRTNLVLGRDAPVSTELGYSFLKSDFRDAGPELSDSITQNADAQVSFRLSGVATSFVFAEWRDEDRDDPQQTDRTTRRAGLGASYDISALTQVTGRIAYEEDNASTESDGIGYSLSILRVAPNGDYSLDASSEVTVDGRRNNLSLGRNLLIPRGSVGFSLGVSKTESEDIEPLVNLRLAYAASERSSINANVQQFADINDNDRTTIRTRIRVDYGYEINSISSLSAGLSLVNDSGPSSSDATAARIELGYNYALGQEWNLVSGISYEIDSEDARSDQKTREIFIGLQRSFDFRP